MPESKFSRLRRGAEYVFAARDGTRTGRRDGRTGRPRPDTHGLIDARGDPAQAAGHLMTLTSTDIAIRSYWGVCPLPPEETDRIAAAGVRAFLRAYGRTD
ncbi:TetR/AcrR family transcriptional regulator C-terminal domain-containing protein [Microtetraspora sp. NBRC 16547]|uniref:TetR/AcrR family transcriptional regulator C-terminal domain-containing protein n=1 Tax=Microtetraspora sp. NBRC 16547 TaxID=3030993 RepID=UPI0024A38FE3|nr:TetR/AcrR family transcriptional regulator C-terminal domain-containing protein [Microtetraspora sp. NBRC 16547]GLX01704.1 hypothetical protein Misp02_57900 [Microtetraspora sp. NBRC 16547]